jgi:hypothetical protein
MCERTNRFAPFLEDDKEIIFSLPDAVKNILKLNRTKPR